MAANDRVREALVRVQNAIDAGFVSWKPTEDCAVVFDSADLHALLAARPTEEDGQ